MDVRGRNIKIRDLKKRPIRIYDRKLNVVFEGLTTEAKDFQDALIIEAMGIDVIIDMNPVT